MNAEMGKALDILTLKPHGDDIAAALETEEVLDKPESLVQIARRLLHVLTVILVLLSVYTFYVASPVLIPLSLSVSRHASRTGDELFR